MSHELPSSTRIARGGVEDGRSRGVHRTAVGPAETPHPDPSPPLREGGEKMSLMAAARLEA